jgi:hypothetical protein
MLCDPKGRLLLTPASHCKGFRFSVVEFDSRRSFVQADCFGYQGEVGNRGYEDGYIVGMSHSDGGAKASFYPYALQFLHQETKERVEA